MKVFCYACLLFIIVKAEDFSENEVYTKNNPFKQKKGETFAPSGGKIFQLYNGDGDIRNIRVPQTQELIEFSHFYKANPNKRPTVYFKLHKQGNNDAIYELRNKKARKINTATDFAEGFNSTFNSYIIYMTTKDGIYTYDPETEEVAKFGTIAEEFKAIDVRRSVNNEDEIYVLAADNKIYNISSQGTVKTEVKGIDYAKDFAVDDVGTIYFLDEKNKPRVHYNGSTTSDEVIGLNFEIKNAFLSQAVQKVVPFIVDGVYYTLVNNTAYADPGAVVVEGLTAFNGVRDGVQFYGKEGRIYVDHHWTDGPKYESQNN